MTTLNLLLSDNGYLLKEESEATRQYGGSDPLLAIDFPDVDMLKCQVKAEKILREKKLGHVCLEKHLGGLSQRFVTIINLFTEDLCDPMLKESSEEISKSSKTSTSRNIKNAACIHTLEVLKDLFSTTCTDLLKAMHALKALNNNPTFEGINAFTNHSLHNYEISMGKLNFKIIDIIRTLAETAESMNEKASLKGKTKALDIVDIVVDELNTFNEIVDLCLTGIERTVHMDEA